MTDIDYASLYGLLNGENDFTGVIERLKENNFEPQHLSKNCIETLLKN